MLTWLVCIVLFFDHLLIQLVWLPFVTTIILHNYIAYTNSTFSFPPSHRCIYVKERVFLSDANIICPCLIICNSKRKRLGANKDNKIRFILREGRAISCAEKRFLRSLNTEKKKRKKKAHKYYDNFEPRNRSLGNKHFPCLGKRRNVYTKPDLSIYATRDTKLTLR